MVPGERNPIKTALVGCGEIAKLHLQTLRTVPAVQVVAFCDQDPWRAQELSAQVPGARAYQDPDRLLQAERPDVVHILTPPDSHASLAIRALRAGAHALVEKPMALLSQDANHMLKVAQESKRHLSVNHSLLFTSSVQRARQLVNSGTIGAVTHVDSYFGIAEGGANDRTVAGRSHWAWRLPGSLFTNFLPHLIYLHLEFMKGIESVVAVQVLEGSGPRGFPTDMRVQLGGPTSVGTMTLSSSTRPTAKYLRIFGTKGIIYIDLATDICILHRQRRLPGMVAKVVFNLEESLQLILGTLTSTLRVATRRTRSNSGLRSYIREFYAALEEGVTPPVSGGDGASVVRVLEWVWGKLEPHHRGSSHTARPKPVATPQTEAELALAARGVRGRVLVTGASGFLGDYLVRALSRCRTDVVALVRDPQRVAPDLEEHALLRRGDLRDSDSLRAALKDVEVLIHAAAATSSNLSWKIHQAVNIAGTEALYRASLEVGVRRIVHISSVIVYGLGRHDPDKPVSESAPYANGQRTQANYMRSKIESEKLAIRMCRESGLPVTVLRLGILYGPGEGRRIGRGLAQIGPLRIGLGGGRNRLPYTYVENAVDCCLLAAIAPRAAGEVYNVVDDPQVSVREVIRTWESLSGERTISVPIPRGLMLAVAKGLEARAGTDDTAAPPRLSTFAVRSSCRDIVYDSSKARRELGWHSAVSLAEGLGRICARS